MAKQGTTAHRAEKFKAAASGPRHGASSKNVVNGGRSTAKPSGPTKPIKGSNRGGV